jgi:hypothetical protein
MPMEIISFPPLSLSPPSSVLHCSSSVSLRTSSSWVIQTTGGKMSASPGLWIAIALVSKNQSSHRYLRTSMQCLQRWTWRVVNIIPLHSYTQLHRWVHSATHFSVSRWVRALPALSNIAKYCQYYCAYSPLLPSPHKRITIFATWSFKIHRTLSNIRICMWIK